MFAEPQDVPAVDLRSGIRYVLYLLNSSFIISEVMPFLALCSLFSAVAVLLSFFIRSVSWLYGTVQCGLSEISISKNYVLRV